MNYFLVNVFISSFILTFVCDRLPQPLPDDDYKLLHNSLKDKVFVMKKKYTPQEKRVYRLFKSGNYRLQMLTDPISGEEEMKIVSL